MFTVIIQCNTASSIFLFCLSRRPQGKYQGGGVGDIINNTVRMKGSLSLSLSPSFCLFPSRPATHLCSTRVPRRSCVWLEFIWTSPCRGPAGAESLICAGGLGINSPRRPVFRQPAWYILIEQRQRGEGGRNGIGGRLKSRDKMTERELFFSLGCHKMDPCKRWEPHTDNTVCVCVSLS